MVLSFFATFDFISAVLKAMSHLEPGRESVESLEIKRFKFFNL